VSRPRVLLADDHRMMAEGLKALLPDEFELVGIVEDGRAMIEAAERLRPEVIIADVAMPNLNGFEALTRLRKSHPDIKVVFLTMHQNAAYARRALDAGASGFVVKHSAPEGIGAGHPCSFERKDFHHPFLDETGGRASRERRSRREGRREVAHVTPERDSAIACGGAFGEGDCERSCDFRANCRIPQVPNDGDERTSQ
jgi:DNA-binding NarL/FixJ family response regulator